MTTGASGSPDRRAGLARPLRLVLGAATGFLPRRQRERYRAEWEAEALSHGRPSAFCLTVLAGAWRTGRALRTRSELAVQQLGLAVPFALMGPAWFLGLAAVRNDPLRGIGYGLFAAAMIVGGVEAWRGRTDVLHRPRTRVAGLLLAGACIVFAALPSKLPTAAELARNDDLALVTVAIGTLIVVGSHGRLVAGRAATWLGMAAVGVGAMGVAVADLHNLLVVEDPPVELGLVLTSSGSFVASVLIAASTRQRDAFTDPGDADPSGGPVQLLP